MFEDSLLESSSKNEPILKGIHWLIALAIGVVVFLAGFFILPMVSANETKVIATQSMIVAVVLGGFALILFYVLADCKRHGYNGAVWFVFVFLLNLPGSLSPMTMLSARRS